MNSFRNENVAEQLKNTINSPRIVQSIVPRPALKPEEVNPVPVSEVHISEERAANRSARSGNMAAVILLLVMMDML